MHHRAGLQLQAHRPLPHLPVHLRGGPAGEPAGRLGQLAPPPLRQRRPLLHYQREPVRPDGDRDPAILHAGGDPGQGLVVGRLPLQGHQPHIRGQLLQQLLLPGPHDPGAVPVADQAVAADPPPCDGPPALADLRRPLAVIPVSGPAGERPRGSPGVGRTGLLHAAPTPLHRVVRVRGLTLHHLPVPGPGRRHHRLQRADRPRGQDRPGRGGPAGRVVGPRLLPGVRRVLAALPPGHAADGHRRPRPLRVQLQHRGGSLLLLHRGAGSLSLPLRRQSSPLQFPQQKLSPQPDQHRHKQHPQGGDGRAGGSGAEAQRPQRGQRRPG